MPHVLNQNVKEGLYMPLTYSIYSIIVAHASRTAGLCDI